MTRKRISSAPRSPLPGTRPDLNRSGDVSADNRASAQAQIRLGDTARNKAEQLRRAAEDLREVAEARRQAQDAVRETAERARVVGEESRRTAEDARHALVDSVRATAVSLKATLDRMTVIEEMRRALYERLEPNKSEPN